MAKRKNKDGLSTYDRHIQKMSPERRKKFDEEYRELVLSDELFKDKIPHGKIICHSCDNPACVNPDHLWMGTMKENVQDMIKKGRTTNKIVLGLKGK